MIETSDEQKRELQKLLREYDSNKGMAGFVCSRPVELMPREQQDRIIDGFCTEQNIRVLTVSKHKLEVARSLELEDSERSKVETAIPTLSKLEEYFSAYMRGESDRQGLRKNVRELLHQPLTETEEGLKHSLKHLIETLQFLAEQDLSSKDEWDRLVDCSQLHDALTRLLRVCKNLENLPQPDPSLIGVRSTLESELHQLETFFSGGDSSELSLQDLKHLIAELQRLH